MINNKKVVALIPARGGSKSIPRKNIANLGGKPLIAWTIERAKESKYIDEIWVSTDCDLIADVAIEFGAKVQKRPEELASDTALVIDTIRYTRNTIFKDLSSEEYMILLEPTCPLRSTIDIDSCVELITNKNLDSVATFVEAELNPHRAWKIDSEEPSTFIEGTDPWLPRQLLPNSYQLNGAIYIFKLDILEDYSNNAILKGKVGAIKMPKERSVDIDHQIDLLVAEAMINEK